MSEPAKAVPKTPLEQEAIRRKCFHPAGTFVEFAKEEVRQSIPERFDKIARKYPDRIAIRTKTFSLTYRDLYERVSRIAHGIRQKAGDRIEPVLFVADHGPAAIIGCLGILKAGKTLIALDPTSPVERIRYIRDDSEATAILTDNRNLPLAATLATASFRVLNIDSIDNDVIQKTTEREFSPDSPAEIRYSSGSTGNPKGIIRTHRRLLQSASLTINSAHICCHDRLLAMRRLSFGCNDILKGLLVGATVCPFDITKNGFADLADLINREQITYYTSSSSIFRYFVHELSDNAAFPTVRLLHLGDDSLTRREVDSYKKHFSDDCILMYRLSCGEAGNICQYLIDKNTEINTHFVPVGYPVDGKEIILLDESGCEVEAGQTGEIAVRSANLVSEYLRRPELTDAKFITDSKSGNKRIYLTGDIGKMLPDGRLIHLGRKDLEVKIRGCKVAIPEVEAALCEFAPIVDAAVKAWGMESGETFLAAYLIIGSAVQPKTADVLAFLKTKLPDFMIPSRFAFLETLPSINGKLDRNSLPLPGPTRLNLTTPFVAPKNPTQIELARIWAQVLSIDEVGINNNFFELGGHSLAATRVVSQVIKKFQFELPIKALFDAPTVAEMAVIITQNQAKRASDVELARMLLQTESMTEEEAQKQLAGERERSATED